MKKYRTLQVTVDRSGQAVPFEIRFRDKLPLLCTGVAAGCNATGTVNNACRVGICINGHDTEIQMFVKPTAKQQRMHRPHLFENGQYIISSYTRGFVEDLGVAAAYPYQATIYFEFAN